MSQKTHSTPSIKQRGKYLCTAAAGDVSRLIPGSLAATFAFWNVQNLSSSPSLPWAEGLELCRVTKWRVWWVVSKRSDITLERIHSWKAWETTDTFLKFEDTTFTPSVDLLVFSVELVERCITWRGESLREPGTCSQTTHLFSFQIVWFHFLWWGWELNRVTYSFPHSKFFLSW